MGFDEKNAIESINILLGFNDCNKIRQYLQKITPNIFHNEYLQNKFKEILTSMYNSDEVGYLKNLLRDFLREFDKFKVAHYFGFLSERFLNKLKRADFGSKEELKNFREIMRKIIKVGNKYQTETIGEFYISPQGNNFYRIVWYKTKEGVYFCEPFHLVHTYPEYDNFCDRARAREILRKHYGNWTYATDFKPLNLEAI